VSADPSSRAQVLSLSFHIEEEGGDQSYEGGGHALGVVAIPDAVQGGSSPDDFDKERLESAAYANSDRESHTPALTVESIRLEVPL
jgi:hypothetical protein